MIGGAAEQELGYLGSGLGWRMKWRRHGCSNLRVECVNEDDLPFRCRFVKLRTRDLEMGVFQLQEGLFIPMLC